MKKKISLLFMFMSILIYGQNPTPFTKIKVTGNSTSSTATKVNVQESNGEINSIPKSELIDYVEYSTASNLPIIGVVGKVYCTKDDNKLYRWNGVIYVQIKSGAVDSVAGKTGVVTLDKNDILLGNVDNTSDVNKPISTAAQTALNLKENLSNKQNSLAVDGTGVKYPTVDAVNTGLALKALDSNVVHKTGNETVAGVKTFSSNIKLQTGILELNNSDDNGYGSILLNYNRFLFKDKTDKIQFLIEEGNFSTYKTSSILGRFVNSDLTATRNYGLPDASGTIALISQTVTNGVTTSSPSQDAVYDFVTANAVTLGTTNGLSLSGQQISLGLSSTSTIGALSSTDWNVFNNKQNNLVSGTNIKTVEGQSLLGSGNIDLVKSSVGLSNVDNTSDLNKPISTATQTALNGKAPISGSANYIQNQNASAQSANMWINGSIKAGAATFASTVTAPTFIGSLSGNASSASNATAFGGFPYGGVYSSGTLYYSTLFNSTSNEFQLADQSATRTFLGLGSNAYTSTAYLPLSGGTLSGIVTAPTAAPGTTGNQIATLDYVLANSGSTSGNYTPTLYDFANTSARKLVKATYSKIGDIVTVFIHLTVDVITANTDTVVTVSLPINKVNTSLYELGAGVGRLSSVNTNEFTVRTSNVTNTNDIIRLVFKPVSSGTNIVSASFSYAIN